MLLLLHDCKLFFEKLASALNNHFLLWYYECKKYFLSLIDSEYKLKYLLTLTFLVEGGALFSSHPVYHTANFQQIVQAIIGTFPKYFREKWHIIWRIRLETGHGTIFMGCHTPFVKKAQHSLELVWRLADNRFSNFHCKFQWICCLNFFDIQNFPMSSGSTIVAYQILNSLKTIKFT